MLVYLDVPRNMSPSINAVIARAAFILFGGRNYQVLNALLPDETSLHALADLNNTKAGPASISCSATALHYAALV